MKKITARASRDGAFWLVYVPEVEQYTQGRNLANAKDMARDLAATLWDVPLDEVSLESFVVELPDDVRAELNRSEELRERATLANSEAAHAWRQAAQIMHTQHHMTVRDIGAALDVSYQRAAQLVGPTATTSTRRAPNSRRYVDTRAPKRAAKRAAKK